MSIIPQPVRSNGKLGLAQLPYSSCLNRIIIIHPSCAHKLINSKMLIRPALAAVHTKVSINTFVQWIELQLSGLMTIRHRAPTCDSNGYGENPAEVVNLPPYELTPQFLMSIGERVYEEVSMDYTEHSLANSQRVNWDTTVHDKELLDAARAGSHTAFAELQKMYGRRLYKCILSITRNHEDAEDALQDTLIRAYRGLSSFEGRSKLSSWLTRIAINSALMTMRKRRSRPEIPFESPLGLEEDSSSFDVRDNALNPEQLCDQNQRCENIQRALHRLDPTSRTTMLICVSEEKSVREIAQELGVSVASAKSRLHRARKRLTRSHPFLVLKPN